MKFIYKLILVMMVLYHVDAEAPSTTPNSCTHNVLYNDEVAEVARCKTYSQREQCEFYQCEWVPGWILK